MPPNTPSEMSVDGLNVVALMQETGLGIMAILLVTVFHGFFSTRLLFRAERKNFAHLSQHRPNWVVVNFYLSIACLVLLHVGEILIWAMSLELFRLTDNLLDALLIAGSTYTTVGFESDSLRPGWRFYPVFIAVSGLFNFAWSTSTMMTLLSQARQAFKIKHKIP